MHDLSTSLAEVIPFCIKQLGQAKKKKGGITYKAYQITED